MKKKRYMATLTAVVVGVVLLATAAFANNQNATGYEKMKNATVKLITASNYSMQATANITLDDKTLASFEYTGKTNYSDKENPAFSSKATTASYYSFENDSILDTPISNNVISTYVMDKVMYSQIDDEDCYAFNIDEMYNTLPGLMNQAQFNDETLIRFGTLLSDSMVGDLKNNFVLETLADGTEKYTVNLQGNQIPELLSAGIDLAVAGYRSSLSGYDITPNTIAGYFYNGATVESISSEAVLDKDGNYVKESGKVVILGKDTDNKSHKLEIVFNADVSNVGSTTPDRLDLSTVNVIDQTFYNGATHYSGDITTEFDETLQRDILCPTDETLLYNIDTETGYLIEKSTNEFVPVDKLNSAYALYVKNDIASNVTTYFDASTGKYIITISLNPFGEQRSLYHEIDQETGYILDRPSGTYLDPVTLESKGTIEYKY